MFSPQRGYQDENEDYVSGTEDSVEIKEESMLPLHSQDALRLYSENNTTMNGGGSGRGVFRSSSSKSISDSGNNTYKRRRDKYAIDRGGGGGGDEEEINNLSRHSLPSPEAAAAGMEVTISQQVMMDMSGEEQAAKLRRRRTLMMGGSCCLLFILLACILIGVLVSKKQKDNTSVIEGNKVVIDKDNPNEFPPTPAPAFPHTDGYDNSHNENTGDNVPYLPPYHDENSMSVDQTNYCPIMKGMIISNFNESIAPFYGLIQNDTLIGVNNNPNISRSDNPEKYILPACHDNTVYGRGFWYTLKGPGAVVKASTCQGMGMMWEGSSSNVGLPLDTQLTVFTSQTPTCTDGLVCVTGNDDASCGAQSIVSWYAEQDRLYYIFVSGKPTYEAAADLVDGTLEESNDDDASSRDGTNTAGDLLFPSGTFALKLELAPIGTCDAAIDYKREANMVSRVVMDPGQQTQVPLASSLIVGNLLGANMGMDPCVPGQWLGRGGEIWYSVTGTGRWITASTCSSTSANEFPPRLAVYKGICDRLTCGLAKASDMAPSVDRDCGFGYSLNWWSQMGVEYYIMVYKTNFLPGIQFGLTVEDLNPPSNDNCTGAIELVPDGSVTYGSTLRATYTPDQLAPTCAADDVTHSHPGVWYQVLGTGTRLTASLCNEVTLYDTKISVFDGSCGNLRCVIANDQWCGYQSSVYWESTAGTTYYILVHGSTGGTSPSMGDFGLAVFEFKPSVNDYCTDALLVEPGSVTTGSTSTASADDYVETCDYTGGITSNQAPGVWYKVEGTGKGMRASTCGSGTNFDTRISIYQGDDCQQMKCLISDDNGCGFQSSAYWHSVQDETYYILVTGNLFSSFGDFVLRIQNYSPTTINDFCANALSASTTTVNLGSTKNATFDGVQQCVVSNTGPGIWYKVKGSGTGMVASTCHIVTDFDTRISVFRGSDCEELECVAGNDDSHQSRDCGSSAGSRVSWLSTLDEDYHILVHGWGALVGTFGLTIEEVVPLVANDFCITSSDIEVTTNSSVARQESVTVGSNVDATMDNVPICGDVEAIGHGVWYRGVGTGNRLVASTCNDEIDERDSNFVTYSTVTPGIVTDFDTQISVFRGGCRTLECIGANNDRCGIQSSVNFLVNQGEIFYVLVHGAADSKGSFGLVIEEIFPQVENDFCDVATPIAILPDGDINRLDGTTVEATYDTVEECIVKNTAPGVWYRTVGTGQTVTVTTCGGQTDFDTRLSVYTGSCSSLECVTGNDDTSRDSSGCGLASTATWPSMEGVTYFIRVHGWGSLTGNFQLSIYESPP